MLNSQRRLSTLGIRRLAPARRQLWNCPLELAKHLRYHDFFFWLLAHNTDREAVWSMYLLVSLHAWENLAGLSHHSVNIIRLDQRSELDY